MNLLTLFFANIVFEDNVPEIFYRISLPKRVSIAQNSGDGRGNDQSLGKATLSEICPSSAINRRVNLRRNFVKRAAGHGRVSFDRQPFGRYHLSQTTVVFPSTGDGSLRYVVSH